MEFHSVEFSAYLSPVEKDMVPMVYPHPFYLENRHLENKADLSFGIGYRHMCYFFAFQLPKVLEGMGVEMWMRLDCDSRITSPSSANLFDWFNDTGVDYAYFPGTIQRDDPHVCRGLEHLAKDYAMHSRNLFIKLKSKFFLRSNLMFYTNFELARVETFRQKEIEDFNLMIKDSMGVHLNRWGDAPIRWLQIMVFSPLLKVRKVSGFDYYHGSHFRGLHNRIDYVKAFLREVRILLDTRRRS